jgi:hypothetical protein
MNGEIMMLDEKLENTRKRNIKIDWIHKISSLYSWRNSVRLLREKK